ncbi:MAG: DNA translocase FtsK [Bacilli bacterium]
MAPKNFYIAKIDEETSSTKPIDNHEKPQVESKVEGFVSPYYGRKVKDKTTYPYIQYGNQGMQYQGLREQADEQVDANPVVEVIQPTVKKNRIPDYLMREDITPRKQKPTTVPLEPIKKEEPKVVENFDFNEEEQPNSLDELAELPELNEYFSEPKLKKELPIEPKTINETRPTTEKTVINYDTRLVKQATFTKKKNRTKYVAPPLSLLKRGQAIKQNDFSSVNYQKEVIDKTLKDFKIGGRVVHFTKGPTVTQFEIKLDDGVKVERVKNISRNLQMNLEGKSIRIEAPIPGKATIGIEVPNIVQDKVLFGELLANPDYLNDPNPLNVILGLDISGRSVPLDITAMPHALIAGTTGSGKSVCINCIINSILYKAHPDDVKLVLIDPKLIEFSSYEDIPHLATPVINDPKLATTALKWAVDEMQNRYELFKACRRRDFNSYNELAANDPNLKEIPYIVIIIDELADLMFIASSSVEEYIQRLAQKARAAGIHLIMATQRPSTDVIKGTIKANIQTRIAFAVNSQVDSMTILDKTGADKLLGKGDMLYSDGVSEARVQGAFISLEEIIAVTDHIKANYAPNFMFSKEDLEQKMNYEEQMTLDPREDEYFDIIAKFVVENDSASINRIQKKFGIGFNRAQSIMNGLEELGVVSEGLSGRPRRVLVTVEELESLLEE